MPDHETPQLYLISPPQPQLADFGKLLASILDSRAVACFRLSLASTDEDEIARTADHCREICHQRDVAIVIDRHFRLVERLGLDGCHLGPDAKLLREVRKDLGSEAIVGSHCGNSRHQGLTAGEIGADYVCFGPLGSGSLGDGKLADIELFQWWSDVVEVPVVAEGGLSVDLIESLAPITDFLAIGAEIWGDEAPARALERLLKPLSGG